MLHSSGVPRDEPDVGDRLYPAGMTEPSRTPPRAPAQLTWARLHHQGLSEPRFREPVEVVRWLTAVQAQEFPSAMWSIGLRAPGVTEAAVVEALTSGRLLRTHVLRPTWHFVAAEDLRWLLALTGPRVEAAMRSMNRTLGLTAEVQRRAQDVICRALAAEGHLTRRRIRQVLAEAGLPAEPMPASHLLLSAELAGLICSGVPEGNQHTYALLDERVPPTPPRERAEALAELAYRFVASHGPVTAADLRWWASLTAADATAALRDASLESAVVDGVTYWFVPDAPPPPPPRVRLLPTYDEYVVGYAGRTGQFERERLRVAGAERPLPNGLVRDGEYLGNWGCRRQPGELTLRVQPARRLTADEHAELADEIQRYAAFLQQPVTLTVDGAD